MDKQQITMLEVLDKIVELELLVSDIYMVFSNLFKEDEALWWKLSLEEKGHASIARSGKEVFAPKDVFPKQLTDLPLEELEETFKEKKLLLEYIKENKSNLTRAETFEIGIKIERHDVEELYQKIMDKFPENKGEKIFQTLNKDCADHAKRLEDYVKENGIENVNISS
jgi:rubrerythrin